ncbi:type II asparaginase [Poriferisphaera sp. WC338]|uniref:type II asparaginase n=1 Tax=Poriferisphaera sp. WC338 TaxID=3425129 RepID=UPI003D8157C6
MHHDLIRQSLLSALLFFSFTTLIHAEPDEKKTPSPPPVHTTKTEKPNIIILATGGTIAGSADSEVDLVYKPSTLGVQQLIDAVPQVQERANVTGEQVMQIASQNITDDDWIALANRTNELLKQDDVDGIVITHGTDTMEETAYFLNLVSESDKPIVLTGALRPATSLSADGPINLYNAVSAAANPTLNNFGTVIVMDDYVLGARDVLKMDIHRTDSFRAPNQGPIGHILYGEYNPVITPLKRHTTNSEFRITPETKLPRVAIIPAYSNMSGDLIDAAVNLGYKGIVINGVGDGNMSNAGLDAVKRAREKGVIVVRASRIPAGLVTRNNEINDDEYDLVVADNLSAQKARILLKLALLQTQDTKELQRIFHEY